MRPSLHIFKIMAAGVITLACLQMSAWSDNPSGALVPSPQELSSQARAKSPVSPIRQREVVEVVQEGESPHSIGVGRNLLLSFPTNVLRVSFPQNGVIEARSLNARTLTISGKSTGTSHVVVFTARSAGDTAGQENLYAVTVEPLAPEPANTDVSSALKVMIPLDTDWIARLLGHRWPDGNKSFEEMLKEEIQKRDQYIHALESQRKDTQH